MQIIRILLLGAAKTMLGLTAAYLASPSNSTQAYADEAIVALQQSAKSGQPTQDQSKIGSHTVQPVAESTVTGNERAAAPPLPAKLKKLLENTTPLNPVETVWLDVSGQRLVLKTEVACRNCILEMLCVPVGIKEHETILRIDSQAYVIHTGLLALGVEAGTPAKYSPKFEPPDGAILGLYVSWIDSEGNLQRQDVKNWIRRNVHRYYSAPLATPPPGLKLPYRELRYDKFNNEILWYGPMAAEMKDDLLSKWDNTDYQKAIKQFFNDGQSVPMKADFVFVGSQFYTDPETGKQIYQAEGGYMICVANFGDAMIDIREESSASDGAQAYEAWTENIPPEKTPVLLEIVVVSNQAKAAGTGTATSSSDTGN